MLNISMKHRREKWPRRSDIPLLVFVGVTILAIAATIIWGGPLFELLTDGDRLKDIMDKAGAFGPLAFIAVQALQTIIITVPGQVIGIAGGALFGWMGLVWSMIGSIIGAYVAFKLIRKFGRPLAEKLIPKKTLERADFIVDKRGTTTLFLMFLIPIFPDSVMCYIAGLTKIPIGTLMIIWIAGRIPSALVNNFIGHEISRAAIRPIIVVVTILIAIMTAIYIRREQIKAFISAKDHREYLKENWPYTASDTIISGVVLLIIFIGITYLILTI